MLACMVPPLPPRAADECGSSGQPSMTLAHARHTPLNNLFYDSSTVSKGKGKDMGKVKGNQAHACMSVTCVEIHAGL